MKSRLREFLELLLFVFVAEIVIFLFFSWSLFSYLEKEAESICAAIAEQPVEGSKK